MKEYQLKALRTARLEENGVEETFLNCVLGLFGESAELLDVFLKTEEGFTHEALKELGDILWYVAVMSATKQLDVEKMFDIAMYEFTNSESDGMLNPTYKMIIHAGAIGDHVKKVRYQGHKLEIEIIEYNLTKIVQYVADISYELDSSIKIVMDMNIEKLMKRYPEGFKASDSVNRKE